MNTRLALATAQTIPKRGDVPANVEEHVRLIRATAKEGARVLVFPELSLTGYELDLAAELAFEEGDARLDPLRALAREHAMTLVAGAPVRLGPSLHIGAFILGPDRSIDVYTKRHLGAFPEGPPPEETVFRPGTRNPLIDLDGRKAAVAICADAGRPSHPEEAAARGASIYLASMFFTPPELEGEMTKLQSYAVRHRMAVVMSNYAGPSGGLAAAGGSAIWSETGNLIAQLSSAQAAVAVATEDEAGWRTTIVC